MKPENKGKYLLCVKFLKIKFVKGQIQDGI